MIHLDNNATTQPLPEVVAAGRLVVEDPQPCMACGYNLRGLPIAGTCPECAQPIRRSVPERRLRDASPRQLVTLSTGLSLIVNTLFASLVLFVLRFVYAVMVEYPPNPAPVEPHGWRMLFDFLSWAISTVSAVGYWKLTTPDPLLHAAKPPRARSLLRGCTAGAAVLALLILVVQVVVETVPSVRARFAPGAGLNLVQVGSVLFGIGTLALYLTQFFAALAYVAWLGQRVPDPVLLTRAARWRWLLPVLVATAWLVQAAGSALAYPWHPMAWYGLASVGPGAALILYYTLLDRLRKHLKSIAATGKPAALKGAIG